MSLYNDNCASMLLGCLCKNLSLLYNPQYPLVKTDFTPQPLHRIIFCCLQKLAESGANEATEIEIDNILQAHPTQYETAVDNNFMEFVATIRELANTDNYAVYHTEVRKFALLRDLKDNGVDITRWWDEIDEAESGNKLSKVTIKDILDTVELEQLKLRNKFDVNYVRDEMMAGEDTEALLEEFEEAPSFGAFRASPYLTQLFMGLNKGSLQMHSAPSGVAKTRYSIMDLCYLSSPYLWDNEANDFIDNPNYCGKGLFIHTEMNQRKEVNPIFLACISGVDNNKITQGQLSSEEKERVIHAGSILQENICLADMPDFTSATIDRKIKEKVEGLGVENVVFDYLQLNGSLGEEFKRKYGGVPSREDLVLKALATDLKAYAEKYNVRMITSSQLNGNEKASEFPDESCLSGAKSIKNKLDGGCIILSTKDRLKEMKLVEPYLKRKGFGNGREKMPNIVTYVYKSRFGLYADQKLKVFSYFDRSIMRLRDYVVLDQYNQVVNIPKPKLEEGF